MGEEHMSDLYGVYSAVRGRPVIRAWARSKDAATTKLAELRDADGKSENGYEDEYYAVRLSKADLEGYKQGGFIPEDA